MKSFSWRALGAVTVIAASSCGLGQTITLHGQTDSGTSSSRFGSSLAATSQYLFVGAPGFDKPGVQDAGNVFSYFLDAGLNFRDNMAITPAAEEKAGSSLAASKSEIIFGVPGRTFFAQANSGAAIYFNERIGHDSEIPDPLSGVDDFFGAALAMGKKFIVAGAPGDYTVGDPSERTGAAYYISKPDFTPKFLLPPSPIDQEKIGAAVATSSKYIAVGAPGYSGGTGRVHIFNAKTREFVVSLSIGGGLFNLPHFGSSLVFSGKYLFVGAPDDNFGAIGFPGFTGSAGSVTQYDTKTWIAVRTLRAPSIEAGAKFGAALSADKKRIAIGSPNTATGGSERGSTFLYDVKTGEFLDTFVSQSPIDGEHYGTAVLLLKRNRLAVGAPAEDVNSREGNVYVHSLSN